MFLIKDISLNKQDLDAMMLFVKMDLFLLKLKDYKKKCDYEGQLLSFDV